MSQCDGDQKRTFVFLNNLMGRTLDPVMPTSSSDDELASRFSTFFSDKITRIRSEIDVAVVNRQFSVDFPLRFTKSLTSHFRLVIEGDVLRYMRETRKTCCSLGPINVSKLGEAYDYAAPAVSAIINSSFDEGHFVASEKCGLIRPYLKKIGLDVNDFSNYRPVIRDVPDIRLLSGYPACFLLSGIRPNLKYPAGQPDITLISGRITGYCLKGLQ